MLRSTAPRLIYEYRFGQPSLRQAFGTAVMAGAAPVPSPGKVQATTLPNGVRVVSHDLDGPHTVVGVYADAGPKYDPVAIPGLSYVMRFAIQTSNMDSSLFQIDRTMRSTGYAYGHGEIGKRYISWKMEGRRDLWEKPFEMLATGVVAPRFHETDIERFRDTMDNQLEEMRWQNPREYAVDQLETLAFYKEPLGSPRMVPPAANDRCNQTALLEHWARYFKPQNIIIAGVNVPHDALIAAYEQLPYKHSAEAPHHARSATPTLSHANESAQFYPGRHAVTYEARAAAMGTKPDMDPEVIAAVGVVTHGRESSVRDYATALVAREVYEASIRHSSPTHNASYFGTQSFYRPYSSAGLIGYTVRGAPAAVEEMVKTASGLFPKSIDEAAVANAKVCATTRHLQEEMDMVRDYCDFIATSPVKTEELTSAIQSVSKADVETAMKHIASQKPAIFATGDVFTFPVVHSIA